MNTTKIKILDKRAKIPKRAHETDTGYDLEMIDIDSIKGDTIYFKTGISLEPPKNHYFEIAPRSSISKLPLILANSIGIIDEHYRGEVLVAIKVLHPEIGTEASKGSFPSGMISIFGRKPRTLQDIGRIILSEKPILTQLILKKRLDTDFEEVSSLEVTDRNEGGFGSTDDKKTIKKKTSLIRRIS